jgi:hypothetical protein
VRLSGLLFDKINQHEYQQVSAHAAAALGAFLGHPAVLDGLQRQIKADSTPLHLVVLGIFAVHNACSSGSERRASGSEAAPGAGSGGLAAAAAAGQQGALPGGVGSYGDAAQRSLQRWRALTTAFRTGQLLLQAAAAAVSGAVSGPAAAVNGAAGNGSSATAGAGVLHSGVSRLLVAANVLLQWLAAQPSFAVLHPTHASDEEAKSRAAFWAAAAQLVAALTAAFPAQAMLGACGKPTRAVTAQAGAAAAAGGHSGSAGGDASCDGGALPEELELLGFEPLRSKHHWHVSGVIVHCAAICCSGCCLHCYAFVGHCLRSWSC